MTIDTTQIKNKLEEEKKALEAELASVGRKNPDNLEDWEAVPGEDGDEISDDNTQADKIAEYEENNAIVNKLEPRYRDIKIALEKIENGTYGLCEVCNEPIDEERLLANPAARTCREHMN
ncbi:MAG: TraR/DksA C4-type zinc finger protein [Minisyncoccia bacterium]